MAKTKAVTKGKTGKVKKVKCSTASSRRGAAGRWNGKGWTYVMEQKKQGAMSHKIGSSKDPEKRLKEVRKDEGNIKGIKLLNSYKSKKTRDAESAAQRSIKKKGFAKDKRRGGATDWFKAKAKGRSKSANRKKLLKAVKDAVYNNNRKQK